MECPTCHQPWPDDGLVWTVGRKGKDFTVSASDGQHAGWALRETEAEARDMALARLVYARDYLSRGK